MMVFIIYLFRDEFLLIYMAFNRLVFLYEAISIGACFCVSTKFASIPPLIVLFLTIRVGLGCFHQ